MVHRFFYGQEYKILFFVKKSTYSVYVSQYSQNYYLILPVLPASFYPVVAVVLYVQKNLKKRRDPSLYNEY